MVGAEQSPRRWALAIAAVALLLAAVPLAGCGGSGDQTTGADQTTAAATDGVDSSAGQASGGEKTEPGDGKQVSADGQARSGDGTAKERDARSASHASGSASSQTTPPGGKARHASRSPHASTPPGKAPPVSGQSQESDRPARQSRQGAAPAAIEGASPAEVSKLRRRCPKGMERATCDDLVKAYLDAQNPPAAQPSQAEAGRCPESLSKAECEAAVAQQAAAEKGASANLEQCLADMTPQCEALLRASFEAQGQTRGQTGE